MSEKIKGLENKIFYTFKDKSLLTLALTHISYANDMEVSDNYERLEFLGDAVLQILSSDFIFRAWPAYNEGELTKKRVAFVCENSLYLCAESLEMSRYLLLGRGEEHTGGRNRKSILADSVESMLGAVYMDGGFLEAKAVFERIILPIVKNLNADTDYKSELLKFAQRDKTGSVEYKCIDESGPDHQKSFVCQAIVNGRVQGQGAGHSKKAAEQIAAKEALAKLKVWL